MSEKNQNSFLGQCFSLSVLFGAMVLVVLAALLVLFTFRTTSNNLIVHPPLIVDGTVPPSPTEAMNKFPALDVLKPQATREQQEAALGDLLSRKIPSHKSQFDIYIDLNSTETDEFIVTNGNGTGIEIHGTSGPAAAYGIYTYLRSCCNVQFSWDGDQILLPDKLPPVSTPMQKQSIGRFRYFSNVCTFSYSFVWWGWAEWEKTIDWLAVNGFNLVLAEVGTEAVWQNVWRKFGLNQTEIDNHFTGPAFLAWLRMGNLKTWGGPLSQSWHQMQAALQRKIVKRLLVLGMVPVLPAFAGHVPDALPKYFPDVNYTRIHWGGRSEADFSQLMVDPLSSLHRKIGTAFLKEVGKMYGLYHAYDADPFNEMKPKSYDKTYVQSVARAIFSAMTDVDQVAIWVKQAWFFVNDAHWAGKAGEYFLTAIPNGRLLMLDLDAYRTPIYPKTKSFYGQPYIWNIVHDYGGVLGIQGAVSVMNQGVSKAIEYPGSSLVGTGLMMEGIFQNYIVYQFMNDRGWSESNLDLNSWVMQYSSQRYGSSNSDLENAWRWLMKTLYASQEGTGRLKWGMLQEFGKYKISKDNYGLFKRPSLHNKLSLWYNSTILCEIWRNFTLQSSNFNSSYLFRLDLVDIAREVLVLLGNVHYHTIVTAYNSKNETGLTTGGTKGFSINYVTFARKLASLVRAREEISDGRTMATEREAHRSHSPAIRNFLLGSLRAKRLIHVRSVSLT